jgi:hypothetical protein
VSAWRAAALSRLLADVNMRESQVAFVERWEAISRARASRLVMLRWRWGASAIEER